jgi:hypothetical protein
VIQHHCTRRRFLRRVGAAAIGTGVFCGVGRSSAEEAGANVLLDRKDFAPLEEIYRHSEQFARRHRKTARFEVLGRSPEDREVWAVHVTDPGVDDAQKQVVVVVCGRHGSELGTRVVGPATLHWLASAEAAETRRRQHVIVVPVANPDGCVRGSFWARRDGLSETETKTIAALAEAYQVDASIDVHSWGGSRDGEGIVTANTGVSGEDVFIYESLAARMASAAAQQGYPFYIHRSSGPQGYNNFYSGPCYDKFHALVFGMEVNHGCLTPRQAAESGLAVIKALLLEGNTRAGWQMQEGYPNELLIGDFFTSIRAAGRNADERRKSRCRIWQNRSLFARPKRIFQRPGTVRVETAYSGQGLDCTFALVCRIRGSPELKRVRLNGEIVEPNRSRDECSTYVSVNVFPSGKEQYELAVEF